MAANGQTNNDRGKNDKMTKQRKGKNKVNTIQFITIVKYDFCKCVRRLNYLNVAQIYRIRVSLLL